MLQCAMLAWVTSNKAAPNTGAPMPNVNWSKAAGNSRKKYSNGWFKPKFNALNFLKAWCAPCPDSRQTGDHRCSARCIQYQKNSFNVKTMNSCTTSGQS